MTPANAEPSTGAPPRPRRRWPWFLPAAAYAAVIFWLSNQSHPLTMLTSRVSDKVLHGVEYGGLAALITWGLRAAGTARSTAAIWAVVLGSLYGITDEIHQSFIPHRSADVRDWLADTVGAVVGAILAARFLRRRGNAG